MSRCLPGETVPPPQQRLPAEEKVEKTNAVSHNALDSLNAYWDGKVYDGFKVTSVPVYNDDDSMYKDYQDVKKLLNSSLKTIRGDRALCDLLSEWLFFVKHMDRRNGMVAFRKSACGDSTCVCMENAVEATRVWQLPTSPKWLFPPITPDPEHPGHYMTLNQLATTPHEHISSPDQHLSVESRSCNMCRSVAHLFIILKWR